MSTIGGHKRSKRVKKRMGICFLSPICAFDNGCVCVMGVGGVAGVVGVEVGGGVVGAVCACCDNGECLLYVLCDAFWGLAKFTGPGVRGAGGVHLDCGRGRAGAFGVVCCDCVLCVCDVRMLSGVLCGVCGVFVVCVVCVVCVVGFGFAREPTQKNKLVDDATPGGGKPYCAIQRSILLKTNPLFPSSLSDPNNSVTSAYTTQSIIFWILLFSNCPSAVGSKRESTLKRLLLKDWKKGRNGFVRGSRAALHIWKAAISSAK